MDCECERGLHCQTCGDQGCETCDSNDWEVVPGSFACQCVKGTSCLSCGETGCLSCEDHWYTVPGEMDCSPYSCTPGNLCTKCNDVICTNCPSNAYPVPNTFDCQLCGSHCNRCSATNCLECDSTAYEPMPGTIQCREICTSSQFQTGATCTNCHISCSTCFDQTLCMTCNTGYLSRHVPGLCYPDLQCNLGQWNDLGVCTPCHNSCQACLNASSCESCHEGYDWIATGQLCLLKCLNTEYRDGDSLRCTPCPPQCETCTDATTCILCAFGYFPGPTAGSCPPCDSSCSQCLETSTKCLSCNTNFFDLGSLPGDCTGTCDLSCIGCFTSYNYCLDCNLGYYATEKAGECLKCSVECASCEVSPGNCLSCSANYFPLSTFPGPCTNVCADSCQTCTSSPQNCLICAEGYYSPSLPSPCIPCHFSCLTCQQSATKCILCSEAFLPISTLPSLCQSCDISCFTCVDTVTNCIIPASGYYFLGSQPGPAAPCDPSCRECVDSATKCTLCSSLFFPQFSLPGTCTRTCDISCATCSQSSVICDSCQIGYYSESQLPGRCLICHVSCSTCSENATHCQNCSEGYFPAEVVLPGICTQLCHISCETCSGFSKMCTTCSVKYFPVTTLPGFCSNICDVSCSTCETTVSKCVVCANGYVAVSQLPGPCSKNCDVSCSGCTETSSACINCADGYFPYGFNTKKCVLKGTCSSTCLDNNSCPDSFMSCSTCAPDFSIINSLCVMTDCFSGCSTCIGHDYNQCISCVSEYTHLLDISVCRAPACTQSCKTCYGLGSDQCLTCKPNASKNPGTNLCVCSMFYTYSLGDCVYTGPCATSCNTCSGPFANNCLSCLPNAALKSDSTCSCNDSYTWDSTYCNYTGLCDSTCLTCSGPEATQCLTCHPQATLASSTCRCNTNYTWNGSACGYTGPCESTCRTCSGPAADQCLTCQDALAFLVDSVCSCSATYTWSATLLACRYTGPCQKAYMTCSSPTQGITCDPNGNAGCTDCKSGYTWNEKLSRCEVLVCSPVCLKCYGALSTNCISCNEAASHFLTSTNTCACKDGYYGTVTSTTSSCSKCHATCLTCSDSGLSACLTCSVNANRTGARTCEAVTGYYWDSKESSFLKCDSNCAACSGLSTECTACYRTFILVGSTCQCVAGTLLDTATTTCKPCDPHCASCFGFASNQCLSCAADQDLKSSSCVCKTENMYNNKGVCSDCYAGCRTCSGPETAQCLSCYSPAILSGKAPASCLCVNPLKPAPTPRVCQVCPDTCGDCTISDTSMCTSCKTNARLLAESPSSCVCNSSFFFNTSTRVCASCHQSCASCSSASASFCTSCNGLSTQNNLYCSSVCPSGYTATDGVCKLTTAAVYHQPFNTLLTPVTDLRNQYKSTYTGNPQVLYNQGLQLTGAEKVQLPPNNADSRDIVLGLAFSIEAWVRPAIAMDTGSSEYFLLTKTVGGNKQILSLSVLNRALHLKVMTYPPNAAVASNKQLYQSNDAQIATVSGGKVPTTGTAWTLLRATLETKVTSGTPSLVLTVYIDGVQAETKTVTGFFFRDFSSSEGNVSFIIGARSQEGAATGFQGAYAELAINAGIQVTTPASCGCSRCAASGMCLIPCSSTQYMSNGNCANCLPQCRSTGCLQPTDCSQSLDPLCSSVTDFPVCNKCKDLAALTGSTCACIANASFDATTTTCSCVSGFKVSGNECVACLSYFQQSELTTTLHRGYTGFTVAFSRQIKVDGLNSCSDIFTAKSVADFGTDPRCQIIDIQSVIVTFGTNYVPANTSFFVDHRKVTAVKGVCSYAPTTLEVKIEIVNPPPPTAVLTAPSSYSIACVNAAGGLTLSGRNSKSGIAGSLSYSWRLTTSEGTLTTAYQAFSTSQSSIQIPDSELSATTLQIELSVKDSFNTAKTSGQVTITRTATLGVVFDCGNELTISTAVEQQVSASVSQSCDSTIRRIDIKWALNPGTSVNDLSQKAINAVLKTQRGAAMTILKSTLPTGTYQFLCTATDSSGNQGTAVLYLTITSSDLVPLCDTAGVPLAPSQALSVKCLDSYDPDDLTSKPAGTWVCKSGSGSCLNKSGTTLVFATTGLTLDVPGGTMTPGLAYVFSLVVNKDNRKSSPLELIFSITGLEETTISVPSGPRVSNQRPIKINVSISVSTGTSVGVKATDPGLVMSPSRNENIPLTQITPPISGGKFTVEIEITTGKQATSFNYAANVNSPPTKGTLTVSPASGVGLSTSFTFSVSGVQDTDGPDYPVTNSFGYFDSDNQEKLISLPTTSNSVDKKLSSTTQNLFNKVCDSGNSCDYAKTSVAVSRTRKRDLQTTDIPTLFDQLSLDQDSAFTTCVMMAYELEFSASDWNYIFSRVNQDSQGFATITDNQLMAKITCFEALISMPAHQNIVNLQRTISALLDITAQYQDGSYEKIFLRQLDALQLYNVTAMEEVLLIDDYLNTVESLFITTNFPDQPGVSAGGQVATTLLQRVTAPSLAGQNYTSDVFNVIFPASSAAHLSIKEDDVLNIWFKMYHYSGFPAGLVSARLEASGKYGNFTWSDFAKPTLIPILGLPDSINLTIPVYNRTAYTRGAQCISLINSIWTTTDCTILEFTNSSVTIALKSVGFTTVVPVGINYVVSSPVPYMPVEEQECDRYYAPVFIMVSLVGAALIAAAIGLIVRKTMKPVPKSEEPEEANPEDVQLAERAPSDIAPSDVHISVPEERSQLGSASGASVLRVDVPDERSQVSGGLREDSSFRADVPPERSQASSGLRVDVPDERSDRSQAPQSQAGSAMRVDVPDERSQRSSALRGPDEPLASDRPLASSHSAASPRSNRPHRPRPAKKVEEEKERVHVPLKEVLAGHYLLGLFLCGHAVNLLLLVTVLLSELFFLGVFYYFLADSHWDGTETSMGYFFDSYGKDDVLYYIWAFVITFVISLILTTLFNPVWTRTQKARSLSLFVGCVLCVALIVLFIILIVLLNIAVCYEYAGRWSVGFLWAFLTEVLIIEFVVAAYRWALLTFFRA